jgi:hypothetical protein
MVPRGRYARALAILVSKGVPKTVVFPGLRIGISEFSSSSWSVLVSSYLTYPLKGLIFGSLVYYYLMSSLLLRESLMELSYPCGSLRGGEFVE